MRKKVTIFLLATMMIFGIGMNTYAVDIEVYTEKWLGAKYDYHQDVTSRYDLTELNDSYDLSSNFFGFELVARRFYYGVEHGVFGSIKYPWGSRNLTITDVRFGCRVVKNKVCTLDIFNGFLNMDGVRTYFDNNGDRSSLTLGGNLSFDIADRVLLQGCCEIPSAGDVIAYNIKTGFLLTPRFALTAGYRSYEFTHEDDADDYDNESFSGKLNGMTLGLDLKF